MNFSAYTCQQARDTFRRMADHTVLTAAEIDDECDSDILSTIDSFWNIERATLTAMLTTEGTRKIRAKIDASMPSALQPLTLVESLGLLRAVKASDLLKWCGDMAAKELDIVIKALCDIREAHPNPLKLLTSEYLSKISAACTWFARFTEAGPKGKTFYGKEATEQMFADCNLKFKKNNVTESDLDGLKMFEWMLPPLTLVAFKNLCEQVWAGEGCAKGAGGAAPAAKKKKLAGKQAAAAADEDDVEAWALFS